MQLKQRTEKPTIAPFQPKAFKSQVTKGGKTIPPMPDPESAMPVNTVHIFTAIHFTIIDNTLLFKLWTTPNGILQN